MKNIFPSAMPSISTPTTLITNQQVEEVLCLSRASSRKRMILPFHKSNDALLHRMLNAIQLQSYIPPHRHFTAQKAESIILLRGAICYFTFSETGKVLQKYKLKAGTLQFGIDTEPSVYHTFIALEKDTVIYEVKSGPYVRATDKNFPAWSPAEDSPESVAYLKMLYEEAEK